jgi:hypothetical protein
MSRDGAIFMATRFGNSISTKTFAWEKRKQNSISKQYNCMSISFLQNSDSDIVWIEVYAEMNRNHLFENESRYHGFFTQFPGMAAFKKIRRGRVFKGFRVFVCFGFRVF